MRRYFLASLVTLFVLLVAPIGEAQRGPDPEGQPTQLREGAMASYWIWHDYDGFHLRTTTATDRRVFAGRIEFSGGSGWVKAYQLGPNGEVKLTNQGITFRMPTERNLVGFDFRMDYNTQATLSLELDEDKGAKVLEHVFMGQNNAHPITNPFTIQGQ